MSNTCVCSCVDCSLWRTRYMPTITRVMSRDAVSSITEPNDTILDAAAVDEAMERYEDEIFGVVVAP